MTQKTNTIFRSMDSMANLMDAHDSLTEAISHIEKALEHSRFINQNLESLKTRT